MRMQIVRQFCLYRRRSEPDCFVPDSSQFPLRQPRRRPHLFSEDEISRLLRAADALRRWGASPLYRQVARLALVLLYTSGLRRGGIGADAGDMILTASCSSDSKFQNLPGPNFHRRRARDRPLLEDRCRFAGGADAACPPLGHLAAYWATGCAC
jgi:hypothetical protein